MQAKNRRNVGAYRKAFEHCIAGAGAALADVLLCQEPFRRVPFYSVHIAP